MNRKGVDLRGSAVDEEDASSDDEAFVSVSNRVKAVNGGTEGYAQL